MTDSAENNDTQNTTLQNKAMEPTEKQIRNCALCGWDYIGDGFFAKGDNIGWFENGTFYVS